MATFSKRAWYEKLVSSCQSTLELKIQRNASLKRVNGTNERPTGTKVSQYEAELLTLAQSVNKFGLKVITVFQWLLDGSPAEKLGGRSRYLWNTKSQNKSMIYFIYLGPARVPSFFFFSFFLILTPRTWNRETYKQKRIYKRWFVKWMLK